MAANVDIDELQDAVELVSSTHGMGARVIISRDNGHLYYLDGGEFIGDVAPGNADDPASYLAVPHKDDLDLGRRLVMRYVRDALPEAVDEVARIFASRGAYSRLKELLVKRGKLDHWYRFEASETLRVLCEWVQENGLDVSGAE